MKKTLILYARSLQTILYARIGLKLKKEGYNIVYVTNTIDEQKQLYSIDEYSKIYAIEKYVKQNWDNNEIYKITISEIEKEHNIPSLWSLFYSDRHFIKLKNEDAIKHIKLTALFVKEVYASECNNSSLVYFINEEIANLPAYLFYLMGIKYKVNYLGICVPRNFSGTNVSFTNNDHSTYFELDSCYFSGQFTNDDFRQAQIFVSNFRKDRDSPSYMKLSGKLPKFKISYFYHIIKYYFIVAKRYFCNNTFKYNYEKAASTGKESLGELINYIKFQFQKKYYKHPIKGEKYFLFPLHYQPEATTLVLAQNYEKQLCAIDLIAKKIPGNYILYVKEHYAKLGHRDMSFYKKLNDYPNIRLINPLLDIHELIINSSGVVTLSGTAGWEAILHGKPVYLLGHVFYESFKYVNKIVNINELTVAINSVDIDFYKSKEYNNELIKYVACYLKSLKKGNYLLGTNNYLDEKNISNLTASIIKQIENVKVNDKKNY